MYYIAVLVSISAIKAANVQHLLTNSNISDVGNLKKSYDFIVIGAGSGGSVVTNRLSENEKWSVLLLEAGKDENFLTDVPLLAPLQAITSYNWGYRSVKLKTACLGLVEGRCNIPRGKALGGTSVINFLLYTRGNRLDFDEWEHLGNVDWNYEKILPYFMRSENCTKCQEIEEEFHGKDGYLNVEHPGYESPLVKQFINSGKDFGYRNVDVNGRSGLGFTKVQATMRNGARCSASKAFLRPAAHRKNLHISIGSRVTRILIDPQTRLAYGVEFLKNHQKYTIRAKKEVILSAGSINSPHLLMLSGVGPSEDLRRAKVPLIQNLKVGYNLQDHAAMSTLAFLVNISTVSDTSVQNPVDIFNYVFNGKGPFTLPGGAEALAFVQTRYAQKPNYPDIELVLGAGALNGDVFGSLRNIIGIPQEFFNKVYAPFINKPAFSITPVLLRPESRGRVILRDSNPLHWPLIIPDYYESEKDVAVMVEGIKMAVALTQTPHFQKYNATLNPIPFPNCESSSFGSDAYWACAIRQVSSTLGHQVGTCKMGPQNDTDAVVNHELKVYGVKNLRVIDGSIMPNIVAGHTNAVIVMIGEKGADMIKKEWKGR